MMPGHEIPTDQPHVVRISLPGLIFFDAVVEPAATRAAISLERKDNSLKLRSARRPVSPAEAD